MQHVLLHMPPPHAWPANIHGHPARRGRFFRHFFTGGMQQPRYKREHLIAARRRKTVWYVLAFSAAAWVLFQFISFTP